MMLRDSVGDATNVPVAKGCKGQTPFSRFEALKGLTPRRCEALKGLTPNKREAPQRLTRRQGGWVGMIVLLLALAIVAWLAKDALMSYGLMSPATTSVTSKAGTPGERARAPVAVDATGATIDSAVPVPTAPMDRARGVEGTLKRQESQRSGGY
jgi:hypothetical protein